MAVPRTVNATGGVLGVVQQLLRTLVVIHLADNLHGVASTPLSSSSAGGAVRRNLIVGGGPAAPGKYPGIVWSGTQGGEEGTGLGGWGCGGAMIHSDVFLTAAHCVDAFGAAGGAYIGPTLLDGSDGTFYGVGDLVPHPRWRRGGAKYDLMLVRLVGAEFDRPFYYNRDGAFPAVGADVDLVGFGTTAEDGDLSPVLKQGDSRVVPFDTCYKAFWEDRGDKLRDDLHLCIGTRHGGRDGCDSDSGTPQLVGNTVVSVTNDGIGCGRPGVPAYNARVSAFADWIDETLCRLSDRPPSRCLELGDAAAPVGGSGSNSTATTTDATTTTIANDTVITDATASATGCGPATDDGGSAAAAHHDGGEIDLSLLGLGMVLAFAAGAAGMWMATHRGRPSSFPRRRSTRRKLSSDSNGWGTSPGGYGGIVPPGGGGYDDDDCYDDEVETAMTEQSPALSTFSSKY